MITLSVTSARENLQRTIETANAEPVALQRHGKPVVVMLSPSAYESMLAGLEDLEDIAAYDDAMADPSPNIPWEQVKADLGL